MKNNILLIFLSAALTLIFLEALIRILGLAPEAEEISTEGLVFSTNPRLRYTMKPNGRWTHHGAIIHINQDGYRGKVSSVRKPERDMVRILCIGDSITLGLYLKDEETYCYQLESLLNRNRLSQKNWEVINFGVNGYNTINEVELLKVKGLKYKPDIVTLQYCFNDHRNTSELDMRLRKKLMAQHRLIYFLLNPFTRILARSKLFLFCAVRFQAFKVDMRDMNKYADDYRYQGDFVASGLAEFKQLSLQYGFRPLVLIFPRFEGKEHFSEYRANYEPVIKICRENGLPYINLIDYFVREHDGENPYPKFHIDSLHPTGYANGLIAEIVSRKLGDGGRLDF